MITSPNLSKLDKKGRDCVSLYTLNDGDGWMLWDTSLQRAVKSRDVVFDESEFPWLGLVAQKTESEWMSWNPALPARPWNPAQEMAGSDESAASKIPLGLFLRNHDTPPPPSPIPFVGTQCAVPLV